MFKSKKKKNKIKKLLSNKINKKRLLDGTDIINNQINDTKSENQTEEKSIIQANNISSKYASSYLISQQNPPIIIYNKNKYMIKGGFWDGRLEINSIIIDPKEKEKHFSNKIYIKEGPIVVMEMTKDEKILL